MESLEFGSSESSRRAETQPEEFEDCDSVVCVVALELLVVVSLELCPGGAKSIDEVVTPGVPGGD